MILSLVVSTLGRSTELQTFLESVAPPPEVALEVIIVDQNADDRLAGIVSGRKWPFPVTRLHVPKMRGLSRGRNHGLARCRGEYVCFPDDDCTYPADIYQKVLTRFSETGADVICGRAADHTGRSINGRFAAQPEWVEKRNVFITQIEWVVFFRTDVIRSLGGYDEDIGVGASSPWQASEGQDITLRALQAGYKVYYDPAIIAHHPELDTYTPDVKMREKARAYGRGMGYVLGKYRFSAAAIGTYLFRPSVGCLLSAFRFQFGRAGYYINSLTGRLLGIRDGLREPRPAPIRQRASRVN